MALVPDPAALPTSVLEELKRSLRSDLEETTELVRHPPRKVLDPASLETASELLRAATARLRAPVNQTAESMAAEINHAYATLVAAIDLVKSHTDPPRVPRKPAPS